MKPIVIAICVLAACGGDGATGSDAPGPDTTPDTTTPDTTTPDTTTPDATADTAALRAEWPPPTTIGGARPAAVVVPDGYDGFTPRPVVLLLGGYDYFARDLDDWIELSDRVDARDFILVLPDGQVDEDGSPYWAATDTCCDYYDSGVDDVAWLTGLLDELDQRFAVSKAALVGHSAGGFMAYRMGCEVPRRLAAIVSIAGSGWVDHADCAVTDVPVRVLQVHGEDDDIMPFGGDREAPGALEMLARWATTNGCEAASWGLAPSPVAYASEGGTQVGTYSGCAADTRLWLLADSDHYPTFTRRFTDDALDWILGATP